MVAAIPFPAAWGFDQIVGGNTSNILNASLTVWNTAGDGHIVGALAFGFIPILLFGMAYIKYQKLTPSVFVLAFSALGLYVLNILKLSGRAILIVLILGTVFIIYTFFWKKG
jgi:hypothetical protein